jgi:hypothetical protein
MPLQGFLRSIVAVLVLAAMMPICHAEIIRPTVRLELRLSSEHVPELRQLLLRFAALHQLRVEDVGATMPLSQAIPPVKGRKPFILNLKGPDIEIRVDDFMEVNRFSVFIYELKSSSGVRQVTAEFDALLRDRWPDSLKPFTDR